MIFLDTRFISTHYFGVFFYEKVIEITTVFCTFVNHGLLEMLFTMNSCDTLISRYVFVFFKYY
jgi:hypothetical protein